MAQARQAAGFYAGQVVRQGGGFNARQVARQECGALGIEASASAVWRGSAGQECDDDSFAKCLFPGSRGPATPIVTLWQAVQLFL